MSATLLGKNKESKVFLNFGLYYENITSVGFNLYLAVNKIKKKY